MVKVRLDDFVQVSRALASIRRDLGDKVAAAAMNKVGAKARVEMRRAITSEYIMKASEVNSRLRLIRARRDKLETVIDPFSSGKNRRAQNLIRFLAVVQAAGRAHKVRGVRGVNKAQMKQLKKQLGFLIKRSGGLKMLDGAFVGNKGRTVFVRVGNPRLPIKPLSTIDVPQMFAARKSMDRVLRLIERELPIEVDRAMKFMLERLK